MKTLICFLIGILCDNIEIATKNFDELNVNNKVIRSIDLISYNSVKLSFNGDTIYKLREIKPRIFEVFDETVYFKELEKSKIRVDFEFKVFGVADFVWPFILFSVFVFLISSYLIQRSLKKALNINWLSKRKKD